MHRSAVVVALVTLLALVVQVRSAEPSHDGSVAHVAAQEAHPVVPPAGDWAGAVLIVVGALFLAAMVIGPMVRAEVPEEVPPAHSHDEPPGTSGHHGPGGTVNPDVPRDVREVERGHGHGHGGHH